MKGKIAFKSFLLSHLVTFSVFSQLNPDSAIIVNSASSMTEVKIQGNRLACASFAVIGLIEYNLKKKYGIELNLSEEYLNYLVLENTKEKTEMTSLQACLDKAKDGVLLEEDWPYQPSYFSKGYPCDTHEMESKSSPSFCYSHFKPPLDIYQKKLKPTFKVRVNSMPYSIEKIQRILEKNHFVIFTYPAEGFNAGYEDGKIWLDSALTARLSILKGDDDPYLDSIVNHFAIIYGYDEEKSLFYVRNSWGKEWGNDGNGTISFAELKKYLFSVFLIKNIDTTGWKASKVKNPSKIKVTEMTSYPVLNKDSSLTLNIQGVLKNLGYKNLEIRCILIASKTIDGKEVREEIKLSDREKVLFQDSFARKVWVHTPDSIYREHLVWSESKPLKFTFPKEILFCKRLREVLKEEDTKIILQTSFYSTSDIIEQERLIRFDHLIDFRAF